MDLLGELKQVLARELWRNEAYDFTPWLAAEENIVRLGEAVGIELEVEAIEVGVGPYSADILARDTGTGDPVVIENQLGKTDHDHLGKALTYSAALGASTVIWIATDFTDEHRRVLDWLNDKSSSELSFFGVKLELWQIDSSRPAVRFNVVSRPSEVVRSVSTREERELSGAKQLQFDWWQQFKPALLEAKVVSSCQTPRPQYWFDIPLGRAGIHLSNVVNTWDNKIGIRVYLSNRRNGESALAQLLESRREIEAEIGEPLEWNPNPENRDKTIALYRPVELENRNRWPEYIQWMVEKTARFRQAFAPRVKALDLETTTAGGSESVEETLR